jgi:catechol 2,3-dioxygenase
MAAVDGVRSIALGVPDLRSSAKFYETIWGLSPVAEEADAVYFRGTGPYHHILALHARPAAALLYIDLTAPDRATVDALHAAVRAAGIGELEAPAQIAAPGGGYGFAFKDPEGRILRIVTGDARHADSAPHPDRPSKITHVVLNARDRAAIAELYCRTLGFRVIDRTKTMTFLCCSEDHHSIAFVQAEASTLNHIAFEMRAIDSVMRGAGRMRDHGFPIDWGVGRHGPGNNVFAYFVGPDDAVIEYTAEVAKVDESYKIGEPEDWTWPPGRTDHWGIAVGPTDRLKAAQKRLRFTGDSLRPTR